LVVDERSAVGTILTTEWVDAAGKLVAPISWPNRTFTPPNGPWVKVIILGGDSFRISIGGDTNVTRHTGILMLQIFDKVGNGDLTVRTMADSLSALFRDRVTAGGTNEFIRFRSPYTPHDGVDGAWFQMSCAVPYARDAMM